MMMPSTTLTATKTAMAMEEETAAAAVKDEEFASQEEQQPNQSSPLLGFGKLVRHFSMDQETTPKKRKRRRDYDIITGGAIIQKKKKTLKPNARMCVSIFVAVVLAIVLVFHIRHKEHISIITIDNAKEGYIDLEGQNGNITMWYRTWGNYQSGIPLLFVHGGPGNAIEDYHNINSKFFDASQFYVVECDQRGTGKSQPSVRNDWHNMKYYTNITIEMMSTDFEILRNSLGIDEWLVFGGSWGSTLSLDYGERYPERCLGLILRGIFTNTRNEFDDVYSRTRFLNNKRQLHEFDKFYEIAEKEEASIQSNESKLLNPYNSERIVRLYNRMILRGDRMAIWRWYVFENNLMEEEPEMLLDPDVIEEERFSEACSVSFFESQLFITGLFDKPFHLLERVENLQKKRMDIYYNDDDDNVLLLGVDSDSSELPDSSEAAEPVHTWICQGKRDEVCPQQYAHNLVNALKDASIPTISNFIDAPHECTDPVMQTCLIQSINEFLLFLQQHYYTTNNNNNGKTTSTKQQQQLRISE